MMETKYILDYLREEMYIEPVANTIVSLDEEYADATTPIGYRLVLNGEETDIVVWYVDLNSWLIKKYEDLKSRTND
jgi:hypothetical protein